MKTLNVQVVSGDFRNILKYVPIIKIMNSGIIQSYWTFYSFQYIQYLMF